MRALFLHANKFHTQIVEPSNLPEGIIPENQKNDFEDMEQCLVVFFCVEKEDTNTELESLYHEIMTVSADIKSDNILLSPFVHLSNNIATPSKAKDFYQVLYHRLKNTNLSIKTSHFGYHKSLLLDIKGHPGSFRYREFNSTTGVK